MLLSCYPDTVTYWATTGINADDEMIFASPIQLNSRWQNTQESIISAQGKEIVSQAIVYIYNTIDLDLEGYLFRGVSVETDPTGVSGAYGIKRKDLTHDINGISGLFKIWL